MILSKFLAVALFITPCSVVGSGAANQPPNPSQIVESIQTFHRLNPGNEALQDKAAGMLIFPEVGKGQRPGLNAEYGEGVLQVRGKTVGSYSVQTPTRSPTLGIAYHQLVILFMTPEALAKFRTRRLWQATDDLGMAIVAAGRRGAYNVKELKKPILGFVYGEEGFFDNLFITGSVIRPIQPESHAPRASRRNIHATP